MSGSESRFMNDVSPSALGMTARAPSQQCAGAVVIALERTYFAEGIDKRGGGETRERILKDVRLPTTWNHIEAALSYAQGLPLLVIVEEGLKEEGLLAWLRLVRSAGQV